MDCEYESDEIHLQSPSEHGLSTTPLKRENADQSSRLKDRGIVRIQIRAAISRGDRIIKQS